MWCIQWLQLALLVTMLRRTLTGQERLPKTPVQVRPEDWRQRDATNRQLAARLRRKIERRLVQDKRLALDSPDTVAEAWLVVSCEQTLSADVSVVLHIMQSALSGMKLTMRTGLSKRR